VAGSWACSRSVGGWGVAMQRIVWLIQIVVVAGLIVGGLYYWARRQPDPGKRALILRQAGFGLMALSTFFFGVFIIGDTFADPGGWKAAGLVAAWAVPLAGLAALSWFRPRWAIYVLAALTAAVIGMSARFALNPQAWRSFEDRHGPIRAIVTFVLVAAIARAWPQADGCGRGATARRRRHPVCGLQPGHLPGLCLALGCERGPGNRGGSLPGLSSPGETASATGPHRRRLRGTTEGRMIHSSRHDRPPCLQGWCQTACTRLIRPVRLSPVVSAPLLAVARAWPVAAAAGSWPAGCDGWWR
jgi:hypothetical protein